MHILHKIFGCLLDVLVPHRPELDHLYRQGPPKSKNEEESKNGEETNEQ